MELPPISKFPNPEIPEILRKSKERQKQKFNNKLKIAYMNIYASCGVLGWKGVTITLKAVF